MIVWLKLKRNNVQRSRDVCKEVLCCRCKDVLCVVLHFLVPVCRCQPQSSVPSPQPVCIVRAVSQPVYCGDHCDAKLCRGATVLVWISCEDDRCQEEVEASSATTSFLSFFVAIFHIEVVGS